NGERDQRERGREHAGEVAEQAEPEGRTDDEVERDGGPGGELKNLEGVAQRAALYLQAAQVEAGGLQQVAEDDDGIHPAARVAAVAQQGDGAEHEAAEVSGGGQPEPGAVGEVEHDWPVTLRGPAAEGKRRRGRPRNGIRRKTRARRGTLCPARDAGRPRRGPSRWP